MMKLVGLLFISGAIVVFGEKRTYNSGRDASLHVQEGYCWFRGYMLKAGAGQDMENPCERWTCKHQKNYPRVQIKGCTQVNDSEVEVQPYEPLPQDDNNVFPRCCTQE
uniref:Single domain-containing protein n=1 Tax=Amblyomma americanum TaxID=6943 RepID=A0A0C9S3L5_AMBAM